MQLYILRHGLAGDRAEWNGDDAKRPLTNKGKKKMAREAKRFVALGVHPDVILTSPLVRARQTADIVACELGVDLQEDQRLAPGFAIDDLADVLREHERAKVLMLVGHEPDLSEVAGNLVGGGRLSMKKGGLACISVTNPSSLQGELICLLTPKALVD